MEALDRAKQTGDPAGQIIMGYTALIQAVQLLGDPSLGRVGVRRTLSEAARNNGVEREKLDPYLHVVLSTRHSERAWLDQSIVDSGFLKSLLVPYPADLMIAYEVSAFVNSVKNNSPECLVPVGATLF